MKENENLVSIEMTCPPLEDIVAFSMDPLKKDNADLAGHIYACGTCLAVLRFANECILQDCEEQCLRSKTEESVEPPMNFLQCSALWKKLDEKITALVTFSQKARQSLAEAAYSSVDVPNLFLWGKTAISPFAVAPTQDIEGAQGPLTDASFDILFVAECKRADSSYWEVELTIPPGVDMDTPLIASVTDGRGNSILEGFFILGNLQVEVCEGIAEIALKDFQANLKTAFVAFQVAGGEKISGQLCLRC